MTKLKNIFKKGDKVRVSKEGGWRKNFTGTITNDPQRIQTLQGEDFTYFVKFDKPQDDLSDDGPYVSGEILSRYLKKV